MIFRVTNAPLLCFFPFVCLGFFYTCMANKIKSVTSPSTICRVPFIFVHFSCQCGVTSMNMPSLSHHWRVFLAVRTTRTGCSESDDCNSFAVRSALRWPSEWIIHLMKTQAQNGTGASDSTSSAEKEWHQSGLWMRCHLHDPSTAAR